MRRSLGNRIEVEVTDASGLTYGGDTNGLGDTGAPTKVRSDGSPLVWCVSLGVAPPRKVQTLGFATQASVVVRLYCQDSSDQVVRFGHVPVPPAVSSDDLFEDATVYRKY